MATRQTKCYYGLWELLKKVCGMIVSPVILILLSRHQILYHGMSVDMSLNPVYRHHNNLMMLHTLIFIFVRDEETFNFVPYLFILSVPNIAESQGTDANYADLSTGYNDTIWIWQHGIATYTLYIRYKIIWAQQNLRLTWYYNGTSEYTSGNDQMNNINQTYYWTAFG